MTATQLTTLPALLSALSLLEDKEANVSASLASLISSEDRITNSMARIRALAPTLDEVALDASMLSEKVSTTAQTAERVGGRVRTLDEEMRRIREAVDRVGQVIELKVIILVIISAVSIYLIWPIELTRRLA